MYVMTVGYDGQFEKNHRWFFFKYWKSKLNCSWTGGRMQMQNFFQIWINTYNTDVNMQKSWIWWKLGAPVTLWSLNVPLIIIYLLSFQLQVNHWGNSWLNVAGHQESSLQSSTHTRASTNGASSTKDLKTTPNNTLYHVVTDSLFLCM